jgi:hypothetical protein
VPAFNSVEEALQATHNRMNAFHERMMRQEAINEAYLGLLLALADTHPDPQALRHAWLQSSAIIIGNAKIHPGDDLGLAAKADQCDFEVGLITKHLHDLASH